LAVFLFAVTAPALSGADAAGEVHDAVSGKTRPEEIGLYWAKRDSAGGDWVLTIHAGGEALLELQSSLCPQTWEKRCWQPVERRGVVPANVIKELVGLVDKASPWESKPRPVEPGGGANFSVRLIVAGKPGTPMPYATPSENEDGLYRFHLRIQEVAKRIRDGGR
jgi:hypothetical protein